MSFPPPAPAPGGIREKSQFRAQNDSLSLSPRSMTAPSLCLNFRALGRPLSLGRPIFRASVHAGAKECRSFAPVLFRFSLHGRCIRVLHLEPIGGAPRTVGRILAPARSGLFFTAAASSCAQTAMRNRNSAPFVYFAPPRPPPHPSSRGSSDLPIK